MGHFFINRWFHAFLLLILLSGVIFIRLQDYEWSRALRYLAFDTFNVMHPRQPTDQVVIVDIDEASLGREELGQWPWPRHIVARLVSNLKDMGARAIVFDMVFAESDRTSPAAFLKMLPQENVPDDLKETVSGLKDHDEELAEDMGVPGGSGAGFEGDARPGQTRGGAGLEAGIDAHGAGEVLRRGGAGDGRRGAEDADGPGGGWGLARGRRGKKAKGKEGGGGEDDGTPGARLAAGDLWRFQGWADHAGSRVAAIPP